MIRYPYHFVAFIAAITYLCLSTTEIGARSLSNTESLHQKTGTFLDTIVIGATDKVTARTTTVTFRIGEPQKIGTLIVTALRAWKSNPEEAQEAKVFFHVYEQKPHQGITRSAPLIPVFRGWMFKSNRAIAALEHPVYDIWIQDVTGAPHNGFISEPEAPSAALDTTLNQEIDGLIDQLMDDTESGAPLAIEPSQDKGIAPQDIPSQDSSEALATEPDTTSHGITHKSHGLENHTADNLDALY